MASMKGNGYYDASTSNMRKDTDINEVYIVGDVYLFNRLFPEAKGICPVIQGIYTLQITAVNY